MRYSRHTERFNQRDPEAIPRSSRPWRRARGPGDTGFVESAKQTSRAPLNFPIYSSPTRGEPNTSRLIPSDPRECAELFAYGSLGIAAVIAIAFALSVTVNFVGDLDRIAGRLNPTPTETMRTHAIACEHNALTNIAGTQGLLPLSNQTGKAKSTAGESTAGGERNLPTG